ncbi:hypothetical protein D2Q93_11955 [Alicyclobacillaceae bacterium I2511]|nr:hypothetical protein D2Q93_11955 [Alicyclobacillaceae bacterium I2511]
MEKKTIAQWAKDYGVVLLDMDGFGTGPHTRERRLTQREFEQGLAECTILCWPSEQTRLGMTGQAVQANVEGPLHPEEGPQHPEEGPQHPEEGPLHPEEGPQHPDAAARPARTKQRPRKQLISWRRWGWLFVLAPLPVLAVLLVQLLARAVTRWSYWRWYFSAGVLAADVFVLWLQPVAPWLSGPGYPYYLVANILVQGLHDPYVFVLHQVLHQPFLPPATPTVWQSVNVNGVPLPLYFTVDKAVTSSLWLATLLFSFGDLMGRGLRRVKSHWGPTDRR